MPSFKGTTLRNIITLLSALFLAMAIFLYFNWLNPTLAQIKVLNSDVKSRDKILDEIGRYVEDFRAAIGNLETVGQEERLHEVVPDEPETANLLNTIDALARRTGIIADAFAFSISEPVQARVVEDDFGEAVALGSDKVIRDLSTVSVSLNIKGSYASIKAFLDLLSTNLRLIDVGELSIVADKDNNDFLEVGVQLKAYFYQ